MPSLRIPFPEKESPAVVVLRGRRITIGRLPQNTIQIRDRTISAYHAELIEEDDHYRLHDLGATNGVQVNGEVVNDFHLREACKLTIGGVECEFSPEAAADAEADAGLALLTRSDSEALTTKNSQLEQTVASLRDEIVKLQNPAEGEKAPETETLKESLAARERDIQRLKNELAVMQRDRANLQRALNETKAAATPAPTPPPERVADPEPQVVKEPEAKPQAEIEPAAQTPPNPAPIPAPQEASTGELPFAAPPRPSLPKPRPLPHAVPAAASAAPAARPMPKPIARPYAKPQPAGATATAVPRPAPVAKSPAGGAVPQATPKPSLATRPPTAVSGPKGTQKIG